MADGYIPESAKCRGCNKVFPIDDLTLDHIKPMSVGGEPTIVNMQLLCLECNRAKSSRWDGACPVTGATEIDLRDFVVLKALWRKRRYSVVGKHRVKARGDASVMTPDDARAGKLKKCGEAAMELAANGVSFMFSASNMRLKVTPPHERIAWPVDYHPHALEAVVCIDDGDQTVIPVKTPRDFVALMQELVNDLNATEGVA